MDADQFKVGDTVRLNSGSPVMTVIGMTPEKINVVWFNFGSVELTFRDAHFPPAALKAATADGPRPGAVPNVFGDPKSKFSPKV